MKINNVNYLVKMLKAFNDNNKFDDNILPCLYLTLLSLNGANYDYQMSYNEEDIIADFLRKINNLKVKIQLKRKDDEVNKLLDEIKVIYEVNNFLIDKYNKDKFDILNIIGNKEPKEMTNLIDALTKENKVITSKNEIDNDLRVKISKNIFNEETYITDNNLNLIIDNNKISLSLDEFYNICSYLLNMSNYKIKLLTNKGKDANKKLINDIIALIVLKKDIKKELLIPIGLVNILTNKDIDYSKIDTSKFKIDNIKITDLYSLAKDKRDDNAKIMKWKNIIIPTDYLYKKIKEIIIDGTYYYDNNLFILEKINGKVSDFKVSIDINDMQKFLLDNINETLL